MKKFTITMILIASLFVIAGIGMIVISSAFLPWNENCNQVMEKIKGYDGTIVKKSIEASAITLRAIDISMINVKIEVVKGGEKVVISYPENSNNTYEIIQTRDKVYIKEESKISFWPFKRGFHFRENLNIVLIQMPEKMKLNTLNLNTLNGKIVIESVRVANAGLSITNGNIIVTNCQIDQLSAASTNGNCDSIGCIIKDLDFQTVNGSLTVKNGDITKMSFQTINGNIKAINLPGKETDYNINCITVNGRVNINDVKVSSIGTYKSRTSGNRNIDIDTVNGKIIISTQIK